MDSPVKKLDFSASNKENAPFDADIATLGAEMDANHKTMAKKEDAKAVARTPKQMEADEPLLQDNPQRFVLFPIKYHEVRDAPRRVKWNTR
jgi:ribonucleoside-diphosphate reductase subunit M2